MSDCNGQSTSVKLALGRLLPSKSIREEIERIVQTVQVLAVRGSLVATTALLKTLERGDACPPVSDSTWWRNCISVCGYTSGTKPKETKQRIELQEISKDLFGYETFKPPPEWDPSPKCLHPPLRCDHMWGHVSALVNEMQSACHNMVASTFHKQLGKAFQREICLHRMSTSASISDDIQRKIVKACIQRCTGHQDVEDISELCPLGLRARLIILCDTWSEKYHAILPCPHPTFIENDKKMVKLPILIEWMYALQQHRIACVQHMATILPVHLPHPSRSVESFFKKKSAKPQGLLPLCHTDLRHIQINGTTMVGLIGSLVAKGEMRENLRIKTKTASKDDILTHFPGLRSFQCGSRYMDGDNFTFQSFRTDGVSASVLFGQKHIHRSRHDSNGKSTDERPKKKRRTETKSCLHSPLNGKRIVCIDPGRTDMIYAVFGNDTEVQGRFAVPTSHFRKRCRTEDVKQQGEKNLKSVKLDDGSSLWSAMNALPTCRDVTRWQDYLDAYLPLIDNIMLAKRARCLRRTRFDAYIRRDRVLDQIIKQILGGSLSPSRKETTLVGLGAAKVCSTGFGHASAPQGRLRFRMEKVHRINVTMIDEFRTSQVCSMCRIARLYKAKHHGRKTWILEACPNCRCRNDTGPKILHHDFHGAMNIRHIFLEQMKGRARPHCFTRGTDRLSNSPSDFHPV